MPVMLEDKRVPKEYWAQPKYGKWAGSVEASFRQRAKAPLRIGLEEFTRWNQKYLDAGMDCRNFSVGTAALIFCLEWTGERDIYLAGFDNLLEPNRLDYFKADRGKWVTRHDWHAENRMLGVLRDHFGAEIRGLG